MIHRLLYYSQALIVAPAAPILSALSKLLTIANIGKESDHRLSFSSCAVLNNRGTCRRKLKVSAIWISVLIRCRLLDRIALQLPLM